MLKIDRNFKIRSAIITSIGRIGDKAGVPALQGALRDRDSRVRANAVESIEEILGEASINILKPLLKDSDNRTKSNAAKALFRLGDLSVLSDLEQMISAKENSTKISAAYTLGQIGIALEELEKSPLMVPLKTKLLEIDLPKSTAVESQKSDDDLCDESQIAVPEKKEDLRNSFLKLFKQGKLKDSLVVANAYIERFPHDLMANFFIGNLNFQLSKFNQAANFFKKVIELDPFHIQAHSNLGIAFYRCGKIDEAISHFKTALKLKPELSAIRFNLANLYLKSNRWEDSIKQYVEGIKYKQPTSKVLANLGFAYQKIGNYEKSMETYKRAIAVDPKDPGIYYNWALILARRGDKTEATALLERSLVEVPVGTPGLKALRDLMERLKS